MADQLTIFGGVPGEVPVFEIAKRLMKEHPYTYYSHRLLMRHAAAELGFKMELLPREQQESLEALLELSPAFERAARKVRAADGKPASLNDRRIHTSLGDVEEVEL